LARQPEDDLWTKEGVEALMAGYSARDIQPRAQTALANCPIYELRDLHVEQQNGALLISGVVSSFYHKQLAQEVVRSVCKDPEVELVNLIRVR
jgi:osmotically-inducible protein OsmY